MNINDQVQDQAWNQVWDQIRDQVLDEVLKIRAETWHLLYEIKTPKKVVDDMTIPVYNTFINTIEKESSQ